MLVTKQQIGNSYGIPTSGYVARLFLLAAEDVIYIAEPTGTESVCMQVLAKVDAQLFEFPLRPKNCIYSQNFNGDTYNVGIQWSYPTNSNREVVDWCAVNRRRRWVAIFQTVNGEKFIAGEVGNGFRLSISEGAYISISMAGQFTHSMWQLPTVEPSVIFSGPTFTTIDFTTDFQLEA